MNNRYNHDDGRSRDSTSGQPLQEHNTRAPSTTAENTDNRRQPSLTRRSGVSNMQQKFGGDELMAVHQAQRRPNTQSRLRITPSSSEHATSSHGDNAAKGSGNLVPELDKSAGSGKRIERDVGFEPDSSKLDNELSFHHPQAVMKSVSRQMTNMRIVPPCDSSMSARIDDTHTSNLVNTASYRSLNLMANHIFMWPLYEKLPGHVRQLVTHLRGFCDPLTPDPKKSRPDSRLEDLLTNGDESDVKEFFRDIMIPMPPNNVDLWRLESKPMDEAVVPISHTTSGISTPVPDILYGYRPAALVDRLSELICSGVEIAANKRQMLYPFLSVECKGQGPALGDNLWVATNQCLGASASCVNIAEHLNSQPRLDKDTKSVISAAFSVATNGTEARLYVTWKGNDQEFYMAHIDSFLLVRLADYMDLQRCLRNIIDWGNGERLEAIRQLRDVVAAVSP